jgi:PAS domain S-box-containing protein
VVLTDEDVAAFLGLSTELFGEFGPDGRARLGQRRHRHRPRLRRGRIAGRCPSATSSIPTTWPRPGHVRTWPTGDAGVGGERPGGGARTAPGDGSSGRPDRSGDTGTVYGAARDVTDRHLARAAVRSGRARLQAIVDHSPSGIFVKDLEDRYVLANVAFLEPLSGLSGEDVLGRTATEIWPGLRRPAQDERRRAPGPRRPFTRDDVVELADGPHTMMTVRFSSA